MKLKFKNQAFQEAATAAVCDVFNGQPFHDPNVYTVDPGKPQAAPAVATGKLGRDPNGVAVFGGEMRYFVQLSHFENSVRKILI